MTSRTLRTVLSTLPCLLAGVLLGAGPARAQIRDPFAERIEADLVRVHWADAGAVDVYVATDPDAAPDKAKPVVSADTAGVYDWKGPSGQRPYFILRDRSNGAVWRTAERVLPLQQGSNFRDVGGYPAAGGKHVRWGLIYRTAANPMLTDGDFAYLHSLGLTADVDLRATDERLVYPDTLPAHTGARYVALDYKFSAPADAYRSWLTSLTPQFRAVFQALFKNDGPVAYHCSAGQDRTGMATALVLSALGVPRDVIVDDYLLSVRYRRPPTEFQAPDPARWPNNAYVAFLASRPKDALFAVPTLHDEANALLIDETFDEIGHRWGSVEVYLAQELGVGPADIARLRALYLE
jgi:protein-tyrosine phosphatase